MAALLKHPRLQVFLARLAGHYLAFVLRTTRWQYEGLEHLAPFLAGGPLIAAFWHERLPLMAALFLRARQNGLRQQTSVLVSRHNDGRLIGEAMRVFGVGVLHGSATKPGKADKGGAAGLRALARILAKGEIAVITPDGPRGPRRIAQPGVASLAALASVPVLCCAAQLSQRITLKTWDAMVLPLPFGRGRIVCLPPIFVPRENFAGFLPVIEAALSAACDRADAGLGA
jgi:lysophospholipid acyltransferase (LPLAT)-like uncharacterized protein